MNYSNFSVEDLASDDYFIRWVNENDHEVEKFWSLFISVHPEMEPRVREARMLVLSLKNQPSQVIPSEGQVDRIWDMLEKRIEKSGTSPIVGRHAHLRFPLQIAATLTAICVIIGAMYLANHGIIIEEGNPFDNSVLAASEDFVEEVNTGQNAIRIHLSDGSIVILEKDSRLRYRKAYHGVSSRDVFLDGQAFFKVAKNRDQPFFVHANEVTTKVLGTSFSVKAYREDKDITVSVASGKVSVFSSEKTISPDTDKAELKGVVLLPNQQVVYQREHKSYEKTLVDAPAVLSESDTETDFTFDDAPIHHVFHVLEHAYGIDIIFDEEVMKSCFITAPLGSEPLFEKLRIICRTIGATYEIIDTKVVINSTGCE